VWNSQRDRPSIGFNIYSATSFELMFEAHDALASCVEIPGVFKYMETNQLTTHHRLQNLKPIRKHLVDVSWGPGWMQEKADTWRHTLALDECRKKQQVSIVDPNELFGSNHVGNTCGENFVHFVVAAPQLLFPQVVLKVVQGFKVVEKWFYHSFVELEHLVVQFLR
jgi:hypothetical protein